MSAADTAPSETPVPSTRTALDFNLPKGDKFFLNNRGQRLHVRTFIPDAGNIKAVLFWHHGYAAHVNGPTLREVLEGLADSGYAVITVDQHGHGYSDGERVLITDYKHLVADNMAILDIVTQGKEDGDEWYLGMDADLRRTLSTLPFFLGGQSLGGGLSLLMGLELKRDEMDDVARASAASRFLGVMLNCPAIVANPPAKPVLLLLKHVIAPLFPKVQLPKFMERVSVPELVWTSKEHVEMGALDKVGNPGGLGWPGTMRLGTGSQLLDMIAVIESRLPEVTFPFLVLHDPEDAVVRFEGTQKLLERATTPDGASRPKEVKEMLGMKHDLISNSTQDMLLAYVDWAGVQLQASIPAAL